MAVKETTTSYIWPDGGAIKRIDVRTQKNGFAIAYLYADDREEERTARTNIRAAIRLKGWGTLSDSRDNEFALRVAGLRSGDELVNMLQAEGFITTPPTKTQSATEVDVPTTLQEKVNANSLRYSGIMASIGNVIGIARGIHNRYVAAKLDGQQAKQWGEIGKGLAFAAADLPLAIAGERDDSRQLTDLLRQLKKFYEKNGIEVPGTASINVETSSHGKTLGEQSMDYMHRYANQIKCGFEVFAAFLSIKAGKEQDLWPKRVAPFFWGSGFAASGLIPERKIDPEKYAQAGLLGRAWMKIQSNPLALGGTLGWTNNAADYYSAKISHQRWNAAGRQGTPLWAWDVATPTTMLGANGLYAISKKTVGGDIKSDSMVQDAYRIASQIINKQPGELREKAMEITAQFFGQRMEIKEHYPEARQRLIQELDSQRQNPWFELQGLAPYVPVPKHPRRNMAETDIAPSPQPAPAVAQPTNHVDTQGIEHSAPARVAELSA